MIDPTEVADALDLFPDWDENMRADVYHAIDSAPENASDPVGSASAFAWERVKAFPLENNNGKRWAVTLEEAAGYESAPTGDEILRSLQRGARMVTR